MFLVLSPLSGALVAAGRAAVADGRRHPDVAAAFAGCRRRTPGPGTSQAILPGVLLYGLGLGLSVTPLTAGVLAAVDDSDLGEASAINDAASRVGAPSWSRSSRS